jgi:ankyrin repeat protein
MTLHEPERCTIVAMRVWLLFCAISAAHAASESEIRAAATRAVALIQSSQKEWDDAWACASCHHQYLPAIAFQAAHHAGIPVDERIAKADQDMAFRGLSDLDEAVQGSRSIEPSIGESYRLWAAEAAGRSTNTAIQATVRRMAGRQNHDGHWDTMDQRPPQSNSPFTTTALAIRSISSYGDAPERVTKARQWLESNKPQDTEGRAFRLLGLGWSGGSTAAAKRDLLRTQQPDGGWPSIAGRASDAYSTGEALFALAEIDSADDPAWHRGADFLIRTQQKDGSWHVPTRLHPPAPLSPEYFESGYPYEHDQYISIMGASWAVMAFARSVNAWRRYYGYLETSTAHDTTPLMLAVPDVEKTRALLDQGADPNTRAKSKFTALDVAAQYRDSAPAIRLLLARGAKVSKDPNTLVLAASAGNIEALRPLKEAGADIDGACILGGVLYATPLIIASMDGDADTVRELLKLGAAIDKPDREGLTALMFATLANRTSVVKLLLENRASPNLVDSYGMTALLYAASVDYGDTAVVEALLAHKADTKARNKEGLTALDRARKFNHAQLAKKLQP